MRGPGAPISRDLRSRLTPHAAVAEAAVSSEAQHKMPDIEVPEPLDVFPDSLGQPGVALDLELEQRALP